MQKNHISLIDKTNLIRLLTSQTSSALFDFAIQVYFILLNRYKQGRLEWLNIRMKDELGSITDKLELGSIQTGKIFCYLDLAEDNWEFRSGAVFKKYASSSSFLLLSIDLEDDIDVGDGVFYLADEGKDNLLAYLEYVVLESKTLHGFVLGEVNSGSFHDWL